MCVCEKNKEIEKFLFMCIFNIINIYPENAIKTICNIFVLYAILSADFIIEKIQASFYEYYKINVLDMENYIITLNV